MTARTQWSLVTILAGENLMDFRPSVLADSWDEPTPRRIGTVLHGLRHHETEPDEDSHGPDWYQAVEELSSTVTQSIQDDLDINGVTKAFWLTVYHKERIKIRFTRTAKAL